MTAGGLDSPAPHDPGAHFDPATGEVDVDSIATALTSRTRLVAITGASNLIGTKPPLTGIAAAAHDVGALVHVDGATTRHTSSLMCRPRV